MKTPMGYECDAVFHGGAQKLVRFEDFPTPNGLNLDRCHPERM